MRDTSQKTPVTRRGRTRSKTLHGLHVSAGAIAGARVNPAHLIRAVREGLLVGELSSLQSSLRISMEELLPIVGISKATFHRRKAAGRLAASESDRVVRVARLIGRSIEVMESEEAARLWLTSPQKGLGGHVPLDYAATEVGAREVEDLLGRIEHSVY